jgi:signal transduction histidine kinase/CheY-like chemotaxis protein
LVLLAGAGILPLLLLSLVLGYFLVEHEKSTFREAALSRNRTFLAAVDAQIEGYLGVLRALAASSSLEAGDLAAFHAEAKHILASQTDWRNIVLLNSADDQLINMRFDYGAPLPSERQHTDLDSLLEAKSSKASVVGNLGRGPVSGQFGIPVRLPIVRDGQVRYILQCILKPEAFSKFMELQEYPSRWTIALVDAHGRFIARRPHREAGEIASPDLRAAIERAPEGWYRGRTLEGWDTYTAYKTSSLTKWTVGVAVPSAEIGAAAYHVAAYMIVATLLSLLLSLVFAYRLSRYIATPIAMLASAARGIGRDADAASVSAVKSAPRVSEVLEVASALEGAATLLKERESLRQREQEALRAADKAKDEFLAMLGHELRNPLSSIIASAHVLRLSKPGAQVALQAHEVIERQAKQMARLVEDLLDVSRLAMGKVKLHSERIDLAALTDRVLRTWLQTRRSRASRTDSDLKTTWINADRARVEQILANLLDNAEKFSAGHERIHVRVTSEGGRAILQVKDEGQGISPEEIGHIFELFIQGAQRFDRPLGGIGLGLTLVKRLAKMHGGDVSVFSAGTGCGASFTVHLPLFEAPSTLPTAAEHTARPESRRILLVEDNEDGRRMMEVMLSLEGHIVHTASTGEAAVRAAADWRPDIALVDIGLPDMDGYEVARRLRALAPDNPPKLVALSGFGQQSDLHNAYEAGFDLHLTKPVSPQFLHDVMSALTSKTQVKT